MSRRTVALYLSAVAAAAAVQLSNPGLPVAAAQACDSSSPDFCIAPGPPDLDCSDIDGKNFTVLAPDPHRFDADNDGIGCESRN